MSCCGPGISQITKSGGSQLPAQIAVNGLPGKVGFEILEYIGPSSADMTWWGPFTHTTRYVFGGNRRVGYVDARDAPGMLQMGDNGRPNFRVYVKPAVVEQPVEIVMDEVARNWTGKTEVVLSEAEPVLGAVSAPKKRSVRRK